MHAHSSIIYLVDLLIWVVLKSLVTVRTQTIWKREKMGRKEKGKEGKVMKSDEVKGRGVGEGRSVKKEG